MKNSNQENNSTFIVAKDNKIYLNALERERKTWQKTADFYNSQSNSESPPYSENNPLILRYQNNIIGIDNSSEFAFVDFIIKRYKSVEKALSLGSGSGRTENLLIEKGFAKKFDTIDIVEGDSQKKNVSHEVNDLNFINLPKNKYDFILCKAIVYHLINLEHILLQINKALTTEGVVVFMEHCGESKGQWSESKIEILNSRIKEQFGSQYPFLKVKKLPQWNTAPLGGIRSGELLPLIKKYFGNQTEFEFTWGGAVTPIQSRLSYVCRYGSTHFDSPIYNILRFVKPLRFERNLRKNTRAINEIIKFGIQLDKEISENESFIPCFLIGGYCKSAIESPFIVSPWSDKELHKQLDPNIPFWKIKQYLRSIRK